MNARLSMDITDFDDDQFKLDVRTAVVVDSETELLGRVKFNLDGNNILETSSETSAAAFLDIHQNNYLTMEMVMTTEGDMTGKSSSAEKPLFSYSFDELSFSYAFSDEETKSRVVLMDHPERALDPTEAKYSYRGLAKWLKRRDRYLVSSPTSGPTFGLIDDAPFSYSFDEDNADHSTGASTDDGKSELSVSCNSSCRGYYRFSYCDGYTPIECHTQSGDYNSFSGSFYCRQSAPGGEIGECVSTAGWGEHFTTNNLLSNLKYCDAENGNVVDIFYTDEVCNTIASFDTHANSLTGGDECDCDDYGCYNYYDCRDDYYYHGYDDCDYHCCDCDYYDR